MSSTDLVQITEDFVFSFRRSNYFTACIQAERGIMKNLFLTNCSCPKCRKPLYLSDIEGYSFVCKNCDENFYSMEVSCNSVFFKVLWGATREEYENNLSKLRQIRTKCNAQVLSYDILNKEISICWGNLPDSNVINNFIKDMQDINMSSINTYQIEITETLQKIIKVQAASLEEALDHARNKYNSSEITLTSEDYKDTEFNPY